MTTIQVVREAGFSIRPIDGVGGECLLNDAFGKPEGAPVCMGIWEVRPSDEPVVFDYASDCVLQYVLEGSAEAELNGEVTTVGPGDFLFVPQGPDAEVKWRAVDGTYRAVYVTYPHWH